MDIIDGKLPGDKKNKKKKKATLRFELDLPDSTDTSCPEYSYIDLVRETLKERKSKGENDTICQVLLEEEEEKERNEAEAIAQYYEVKYGAPTADQKPKRKDKVRDLVGAGYGYDENDPFVDDSEAYDEIVPATLTTQHGGFYINTGQLNFRAVSDQSDTETEDVSSDDTMPLSHHTTKKKKKRILSSLLDTDESEGDFKTDSGINKKKRKKLNGTKDHDKKKKRKISLNGKDKVTGLKQNSKKIKQSTSLAQKLVAKAKAQQMMSASSVVSPVHTTNGAAAQYRKSSSESTSSLKSKELVHLESKDLAMVAKQATKKLMNIGVNLGSMVKNGPEQESSKNPASSTSPENFELPPNLPQLLGDKIESLKKIAKLAEGEGKLKFFSIDVNRILLGIEESSQSLRNKERQGMYQHIAQHLPCSKDTLLKRVKKLQVHDSDQLLKEPIEKLRIAVTSVMKSQIEAYIVECDTKSDKFPDKTFAASTDEDDECESMQGVEGGESGAEKLKRSYNPRRKFKWDDNLRKLLCDVVRVKMNIYERFKVREKQNPEEYLKSFLETTIKPLWPKPWMQTRNLFKESRSAHQYLTLNCQKQKKPASNKKVLSATKESKSTDVPGLKHEIKDLINNSAGQSENAKTFKKQLVYVSPDTKTFKPTLGGSNVLVNSNKDINNGLIDLTGDRIELSASIDGENSPKASSKVSHNNASKLVDKASSNTWRMPASKLSVKNKLATKTMSSQPSCSGPSKLEKSLASDPKNNPHLGFDSSLMLNSTMEQYASNLIKIMMSPNPGELSQGSSNYLDMPSLSNYNAISQILGLGPDDVMQKNTQPDHSKFEFKIAPGSSKPISKSGPSVVDLTSKKTQSWTNSSTPQVIQTENRMINLSKSKGYSPMPTTPVGTTSFSGGLSIKNLTSTNSTVLSSNFIVPSAVENSKYIFQRSRPTQRGTERCSTVSTNISNSKIRRTSPDNVLKHSTSMTFRKNVKPATSFSAARTVPVFKPQNTRPGAALPQSSLSIDLNRVGLNPMLSPSTFPHSGGSGKSFSQAFTSSLGTSFSPVSKFNPPTSPGRKFVSSNVNPGLPFSSSNYSYPQVMLDDIQLNKSTVKQATNIKGNPNR